MISFIKYKGKKPKKTLIKEEFPLPCARVYIEMRDLHGNKYTDTGIVKTHKAFAGMPLERTIARFSNNNYFKLDKGYYFNVKVIKLEILDEFEEITELLTEVVES